ncbi:MAG: metallophosphoesterase [Acidobacteria bacterium]|nr:metallophosphoesterase [Acidobacteriota bacterium]MBV9477428.1 metallophosphoesterase [Acidobacteriota bacterium]
MAGPETLRIAAVADIHVKKTAQGALQPLFTQITEQADVLLLCGDLTDYGAVDEAKILAKDITSALRIPAIGVLGNHDFESGHEKDVVDILTDAGVVMLDGDSYEFRGVGFAGVKGFAGGFGRRALGAWGEKIIKDFVHETINEALKLEAALARLRTPQKIGVLHYSPIQATVNGEPPEIIAFLGSSRLEEPLDRYRVNAVFHGHAHRGTAEGRTKGNAPVYNVAMPVLATTYPDRPPFRVVEVPVETAVESPVASNALAAH